MSVTAKVVLTFDVLARNEHQWRTVNLFITENGRETAYCVDRRDMLAVPHTDEQRYQFLEARSQRDAAEADRLAKKLSAEGKGLPVVCGDDREKMREVIEAMRPIVEAARLHRDADNCRGEADACYYNQYAALLIHGPRCAEGAAELALFRAVDDNRDRLAAAMSAWADSQTVSEAEKLRAKCAAMEKVVDAACAWVDRGRRHEPDRRVRDVTAAVDTYRKQVQR